MNRFYILIVLSCIVYSSNLGGTSIYILDEAKNASCAMEMMDNKQWIIPTFNGKLRTDKPPLHYYFMQLSYQMFGVNAFAARFFSAVTGILLILVVYRNVRSLINETVAFYTALVLLCSIQLTIQFHLAVPDPYLILLVTVALFSFFNGYHHHPNKLIWFYIATALGFMTKGLIAIVLPGGIIVLYLLFTQPLEWYTIKKLNLLTGLFLFSIIALPWYAAVGYLTDGEWLRGFFIQHNLDRYTATMEGHRGFPGVPFVILIAALLPFSVFIPQAIGLAWNSRKEIPFLLFCGLTALVFAGFFSFSRTILPSYPAPAVPLFAILIGYFLFRLKEFNTATAFHFKISLLLNTMLSIALCIAGYIALSMDKSLHDLEYIALIFIVLPVGSIAGWYFFHKRNFPAFIYSWSGSWIVLGLLFFYVAYPKLDARNPVTESIPIIRTAYPHHAVVGYHLFNPAYVFGLRKVIETIDSPEELKDIIADGEKIIVVTRAKYKNELSAIQELKVIYSKKDLFENSETVVFAN